ncbi:MAG: protein kinase, partial [Deefgea sp.]
MLAGNQLTCLPLELANCQSLELIRLAANRLPSLPEVLFELPRLSWLAMGGNPFNVGLEQQSAQLAQVAWSDLVVGELLGEGASGAIYQVQYRQGDDLCDAALKLFKGQVTSDGLPESEMAACRAAGSHPHLIGVLAQLIEHPENAQGLLVPLIPPQFAVLAQPPSLVSCTRDEYRADVSFELPVALNIARSIAAAAAHLHQCGIVHGDLYAHNILHDSTGFAYLGDFGAAAFYDRQSIWAQWIEKVEIRAFACLLEELLMRLECASGSELLVDNLRQLQLQCAQANVLQRPTFAAVLTALGAML